jgi:hypothetical protein
MIREIHNIKLFSNIAGGTASYICKKHTMFDELISTVSFCGPIITGGFKCAGFMGAFLGGAGCIGYKLSDILYTYSLEKHLIYEGEIKNVK